MKQLFIGFRFQDNPFYNWGIHRIHEKNASIIGRPRSRQITFRLCVIT